MPEQYSGSGCATDRLVAPRPFTAAVRDFAAGRSRPSVELETLLGRVSRYEGQLHAFVCLATDEARHTAAESDERWARGAPLSAVDGMVLGIKDVFETFNMPTGQGSPIWAGSRTQRDCAVVQALREAGGIILGKTTTTEFALTEPFHETRNPYDAERSPGGSSSGSAAAVAAGFVHAALGTQVVGSTIRPASYCGCFAFKPSIGALNRGGSFDYLSHSCVGVLGPDLASLWHLASAISTRVGGDPGYQAFGGVGDLAPGRQPHRLLALYPPAWERVSGPAQAAFAQLLGRLRTAGIEIADSREHPSFTEVRASWCGVEERVRALINWELRWPLGGYATAGHVQSLSTAIHERLTEARRLQLGDYHEQLVWREQLRREFALALQGFDAALTLSATGGAPLGWRFTGDPGLNVVASVLGAPCISLPVLSDSGLPLGLQVIGPLRADEELFAVSGWIHAAVDHEIRSL